MKGIESKIQPWVKSHYLNLAIYNAFIMVLVLLHTANYFDPFWLISINVVIVLGLVASIFLLGAKSSSFFVIALVFWLFAAFLKFAKVDVWAERTAIYAFETFVIGIVLLFVEDLFLRDQNSSREK